MKKSLFDLIGRVALITGGSRGIGKAIARGFAEAGADVVISSRDESQLAKAADEIRQGLSVKVEPIVADMTNRDDVNRLADATEKRFGRIDILINNAGTNIPQPIESIRDEDWDNLIELNLTSCMALSRAVVPGMKKRSWGRIVHIASIMGLASNPERSGYSATKAALIGMARAMALELGPFGITVNCLAPGPILTELPGRLLTDAQKQSFATRTAVGRWGEPQELVGPALLLASDAGSYVTGATLVVDGGTLCRTF